MIGDWASTITGSGEEEKFGGAGERIGVLGETKGETTALVCCIARRRYIVTSYFV